MASTIPPTADVVIVGAGPAGLVCAISLAARKVPFVLLDALPGGLKGSRAVIMHANALEALEAIDQELVDDILKASVRSKTVECIDMYEKLIFSVDMKTNAPYTKYPYILLIGQNEVEGILRSYLERSGNSVIWNERVVEVNEVAGGSYGITLESGKNVLARYVVASDGCRSTIRAAAGICYIDTISNKESVPSPRDASFIVADVLFSEPLPANIPRDTFRLLVHPKGPVVTAPLVDPEASADGTGPQRMFRLYIGVQETPPSAPDAAYVQAILDARGPGINNPPHKVPQVARVVLSSRSRARFALAETFVKRSSSGAHIILVGDAAHRHGPSGGLGMNLAICDGHDAAVAIQQHRETSKNGNEDLKVFDAYTARRRTIAAQVVAMVEQLHKLEMGGEGWVLWVRIKVVNLLLKIPFVNSTAAWMLSGLVHTWNAK